MKKNIALSLNNWWWHGAFSAVDGESSHTHTIGTFYEASGLTGGLLLCPLASCPGTHLANSDHHPTLMY